MLWPVLWEPSTFVTDETYASESVSSFKERVKIAIKTLSASLTDCVSKNDIDAIQAMLEKVISDAENAGQPIRFGIGILDRDGVTVAGRYIIGTFKGDDFSKYKFVKNVFKHRKIVQDRLYFQDRSELLIVCAPLVRGKNVVGAIVLRFNPTKVKEDYGLNTEQFLALDLNK